jgi:hypothetical protein
MKPQVIAVFEGLNQEGEPEEIGRVWFEDGQLRSSGRGSGGIDLWQHHVQLGDRIFTPLDGDEFIRMLPVAFRGSYFWAYLEPADEMEKLRLTFDEHSQRSNYKAAPDSHMMPAYLEAIGKLDSMIRADFDRLIDAGPISLAGNTITKSILLSMKALYESRYAVCHFLDKRQVGAGADFMFEVLIFHLKAFLSSHGSHLTVSGERSLPHSRIRPDISVWLDDSLVAVIECKTSLGWSRTDWGSLFNERNQTICEAFPSAACYLVVLDGRDAPGLQGDNLAGQTYFALCRRPPHKVNASDPDSDILMPIEPMFSQILALSRDSQ